MRDYEELVKALRENAEWADGNVWEVPIILPDNLKQAADAIEDLIAALTASNEVIAKSRDKWISVEDRLPKLGEEVLVYYRWINPPEKCSITRDFMHIHDISMEPVWRKHKGGKVTHWMPLPEPPKEDGNA